MESKIEPRARAGFDRCVTTRVTLFPSVRPLQKSLCQNGFSPAHSGSDDETLTVARPQAVSKPRAHVRPVRRFELDRRVECVSDACRRTPAAGTVSNSKRSPSSESHSAPDEKGARASKGDPNNIRSCGTPSPISHTSPGGLRLGTTDSPLRTRS